MKQFSSLIISFSIVLGLTSCTKDNANVMVRNPENEALVQKYLESIVKGDTASVEGFLADNFMSYGPGTQDSADRATTVATYKRNWKEWSSMEFDRYVILSNTIKEGRVAGDWVMD